MLQICEHIATLTIAPFLVWLQSNKFSELHILFFPSPLSCAGYGAQSQTSANPKNLHAANFKMLVQTPEMECSLKAFNIPNVLKTDKPVFITYLRPIT